jgi:transposase
VLARIANPASKMASVDMLEEDFGISLPLDRVYRMMDKLDTKAIEKLKDITYKNTASLFGGKIKVIFFDATTIYFESFTQDSLKKNGYSKDKKFGQPQVLFSLLVTTDGLPIGYKIFP